MLDDGGVATWMDGSDGTRLDDARDVRASPRRRVMVRLMAENTIVKGDVPLQGIIRGIKMIGVRGYLL